MKYEWPKDGEKRDFQETALREPKSRPAVNPQPKAYDKDNSPQIIFQEPRREAPALAGNLNSLNLELLQSNLGNCLGIIDDEIMKGYVTRLDRLPVIKPDEEFFKSQKTIQFFKISELVYQEEEFSVDKLGMVFHALSDKPCTLVLMLKSDGERTGFYLGVRPNGANSAGTLRKMLQQSLLGFFPGSRISEYYDEDLKEDLRFLEEGTVGCVSSVTCVADYIQDQDTISNKEFIQGLEKFVYAMQGRPYTALFIADSLEYDELAHKKREYEQIYTQMSPFANMQMNFMVSDGGSSSAGTSEGVSANLSHTHTEGSSKNRTDTKTHTEGVSKSHTDTKTYNHTHTDSKSRADGTTHMVGSSENEGETVTKGRNVGAYGGVKLAGKFNVGLNAGVSRSVASSKSHTDSVSDSIAQTLTHGFSVSHSHGQSKGDTYGTNASDSIAKGMSTGTTQSDAYTAGEAFNLVNTKTITDTFGSSKGITLNAQNMTLGLVMQKIQKHLERIEECESFGMWNFAAYFLGESAAETETAANIYKSVVAGTGSGIERNAVNSWIDETEVKGVLGYLKYFRHPQFGYNGFHYEGERYLAVDPTALVSTKELAIHMGLPRHSVRGLPVVEHAPFAQEVITRRACSEKSINLGVVYHLGQKSGAEVRLDLDSLAMHTFITGSTGSGKSNVVYHLLHELRWQKIPFLVVEPAKGEYGNVFTDVRHFGTNSKLGEILRINPFSFPEGIHVLEHIERIVEIFNVCWPMYAAMPAVLKDSIEQAYISAGWDLDLSENTKIKGLYPTFDDILRELNTVIKKSEYSADTKGDYIGSLSTRIKSLTNGINGRIFVSNEMDLRELFDKSAIVDISRVGSMETKSLLMGLIVLKLQEYRMSVREGMNVPLKHVTVLEEAHNLLKKTSTEQSAESSNMVGKSVEMLTNAIAEIRTYGEGFVIVDQAPNLLDTAAIRNTNTKIILRLPESSDREITGGSVALKEQQFGELSRLPTGVAAVYQNDWQEAVLCSLPKYEVEAEGQSGKETASFLEARKKQSRELLHLLLKKQLTQEEARTLPEKIRVSNASAKIRKDLIMYFSSKNQKYEWAVADYINKNFALEDVFRGTSRCSGLEQLAAIMSQNLEEEFSGFDQQEMLLILYYICRIEHEKHPENQAIEQLRTEYLKERVV